MRQPVHASHDLRSCHVRRARLYRPDGSTLRVMANGRFELGEGPCPWLRPVASGQSDQTMSGTLQTHPTCLLPALRAEQHGEHRQDGLEPPPPQPSPRLWWAQQVSSCRTRSKRKSLPRPAPPVSAAAPGDPHRLRLMATLAPVGCPSVVESPQRGESATKSREV